MFGIIPLGTLLSSSATANFFCFNTAKSCSQRGRTITSGTSSLIECSRSTLSWFSLLELNAKQPKLNPFVAKLDLISFSLLLNCNVTKSLVNPNQNRQTKARGHAN